MKKLKGRAIHISHHIKHDKSKMVTLPLLLRKNGFSYYQVFRGSRSCLYAQKVHENLNCFEVFLIKVKPLQKLFGKLMPEREIFPPNEAFGHWAWSFRNYEDALRKFNELENNMGKDIGHIINVQTDVFYKEVY